MSIFQSVFFLLNNIVFSDTIASIFIIQVVRAFNIIEMKQNGELNEGSSLLLPGKTSFYDVSHASNQNKEEIQKTPSLNALNHV